MPLKKNTSSECKDTQLLTIFKTHFSGLRPLQRKIIKKNGLNICLLSI